MCLRTCSVFSLDLDFGLDRNCDEKLCQHECTNLNGTGFICSCRPGYTVDPDSTYTCLGTGVKITHRVLQSRANMTNVVLLLLLLKVTTCLSPLFQTSMSVRSMASVLRPVKTPRAATTVSVCLATGKWATVTCVKLRVRK